MTKARRETPTPYLALGRRIKELRDRQRISQREMARRANFSQSYGSPLERGKHRPDTGVLLELARVLDADFNELAVLAGYSISRDGEPIYVQPTNASRLSRLDRFPGWLLDQFYEFGRGMEDRLIHGTESLLELEVPQDQPGMGTEQERDDDDGPDEPDSKALGDY